MSEVIAIVAAMPGELAPLVRRWKRVPVSPASSTHVRVSAWRTSEGGREYVAVCGGMGAEAATRAFAAVQRLVRPSVVVSIGWAGALVSGSVAGTVIRPEAVLDTQTGERFGSQQPGRVLVTLSHMASAKEKVRLRETYQGAVAVDMEAATLARLSAAAGCAFRAIKAISDTADEQLPDMNPYLSAQGQFRTASFAAHMSVRPVHWASLIRLGRQARLAAGCLARAIAEDFQLERER